MKGAILVNNPYHDADCCYSTNKELADRMENVLFYNDPELEKKIDSLKDIDYIVALINETLWGNLGSLSRLGVPVLMATGDLPKRLRDDKYKRAVEFHKVSGIIVENL